MVNELDQAWRRVEGEMPEGWSLRGLVRGPREVDPQIRSASWVAQARPEQPRADEPPLREGRGSTPLEALEDLLAELRSA